MNEQGTDQARSDAIEAQNLAESVRECAAAAETAAARSKQPSCVRHLDPLVSRSATPSREERGPLPTRRQRRQRGGSDYAPAVDSQLLAQGSSQDRRA
ncbi:hypothetical protein PF010_g18082 [Phytophthora fragariae]|uniref:Uncharacterized protein n=1 Tax=Phytophthora fragariae TaxID=53985 RepID=A0A6A3QET8_9STRA|nr:hypothetical protein PF006_g28437 [Phytophthora fragariae]KAE9091710.1 hypothetical protein PF010_g18082 [Phytophthora fragariae]KAE9173886.1 hypothetical protein PF002_g29204 [Phytophthora fragariae]